MKYALGEKCKSVDRLRSVSIDLLCADVPMKIISAQEPSKCQYHMVVESYHGCPTVSCYFHFFFSFFYSSYC